MNRPDSRRSPEAHRPAGRTRPPRDSLTGPTDNTLSPRPAHMGVAQPATELTIASDLAEARRVQELIETALAANSFTEHDIFAIKLALEEALVNAIKHGNQMDPDKRVYVTYSVTTERFDI